MTDLILYPLLPAPISFHYDPAPINTSGINLVYTEMDHVLVQVIDKSFGFDTAVEEAQRAINAAHVEAESAENGVGVVKLMGRYSGKLTSYDLE